MIESRSSGASDAGSVATKGVQAGPSMATSASMDDSGVIVRFGSGTFTSLTTSISTVRRSLVSGRTMVEEGTSPGVKTEMSVSVVDSCSSGNGIRSTSATSLAGRGTRSNSDSDERVGSRAVCLVRRAVW